MKEREALIRRVKIKSVSPEKFSNDINCKLSERPSEIFNFPGNNLPEKENESGCANCAKVINDDSGKKLLDNMRHPGKHTKGRNPLRPVTNFPAFSSYEGGIPDDATTLEIFSLRRRVSELASDVATRNDKITRALAELQSQRRFFRLLISDNQGETYDQIMTRIRKIESTISYVEDPAAGHAPPMEIPERWKKKTTTRQT